jgi:hypothetical protein
VLFLAQSKLRLRFNGQREIVKSACQVKLSQKVPRSPPTNVTGPALPMRPSVLPLPASLQYSTLLDLCLPLLDLCLSSSGPDPWLLSTCVNGHDRTLQRFSSVERGELLLRPLTLQYAPLRQSLLPHHDRR